MKERAAKKVWRTLRAGAVRCWPCAPVLSVLSILVLGAFAQAQLATKWDYAGSGVYYTREADYSVRYSAEQVRRKQESTYGSVRQGAVASLDTDRFALKKQQVVRRLPPGARELTVAEGVTYYVADGTYYRRVLHQGKVAYSVVDFQPDSSGGK